MRGSVATTDFEDRSLSLLNSGGGTVRLRVSIAASVACLLAVLYLYGCSCDHPRTKERGRVKRAVSIKSSWHTCLLKPRRPAPESRAYDKPAKLVPSDRGCSSDRIPCDIMLLIGGESVKAQCRQCGHFSRHVRTCKKCFDCGERVWLCDECPLGGIRRRCCWNCFPEPHVSFVIDDFVEDDGGAPWSFTNPVEVTLWEDVEKLITPLIGRTQRLVNQTQGFGFTAHYYAHYLRKGSAVAVPDLVLSRGELVLAIPNSFGAARFVGDQCWRLCSVPFPHGINFSKEASRRLEEVTGEVKGPNLCEFVTRLHAKAEKGDNHVFFLSRLYALLHSSAVVEAVGGHWVGVDDPGPVRQFILREHWNETMEKGSCGVIIPLNWTKDMCNVIIAATQPKWPVKAVLPGTDHRPMCMGWELPENFRFALFLCTVHEAPVSENLASSLSVNTVLTAIDAYVSSYGLQPQWTHVVNRGLAGVMLLAGQTPDYPHPNHLAELLYPLWQVDTTMPRKAFNIPLFAKATAAGGVIMQGLLSKAIYHHVPWQIQKMAIANVAVEGSLSDMVSNKPDALVSRTLGSGIAQIMAQLLWKGGVSASSVFTDASPAMLKPFFESLGPITLQKYIYHCMLFGDLQVPTPMAPWEWFILGMPECEDIGCCVLRENSFSGATFQELPELLTAFELAKMAMLGLMDDNGYISETGPEMPLDEHQLVTLPDSFCKSRVGRAYLRGQTLKLSPEKIVPVDVTWNIPEDLRPVVVQLDWGDMIAPKNAPAVVKEARQALGDLAQPDESEDESSPNPAIDSKPRVVQAGDELERAWDNDLEDKEVAESNSYDTGCEETGGISAVSVEENERGVVQTGRPSVVPDRHVRERYKGILEIIQDHPTQEIPAPTMALSHVAGGGHCGPNALAESARMQCLGSPYDCTEFWKQRAEAKGMFQTLKTGWWDDRVFTAVSDEDAAVAWYDLGSAMIRHHGSGRHTVYYAHKDEHFIAAAPVEAVTRTKLEQMSVSPTCEKTRMS